MYGAMQIAGEASLASVAAVSEPGAQSHTPPRSLALGTQGQVKVKVRKIVEKPWMIFELLEQKLEESSAEASHCWLGMRLIPAWDTLQLCLCLATHQIPALTCRLISWPQVWWLIKGLPGGLDCHLIQHGGTGLLLVLLLPLPWPCHRAWLPAPFSPWSSPLLLLLDMRDQSAP